MHSHHVAHEPRLAWAVLPGRLLLACAWVALLILALVANASAGVLRSEDLQARFPAPYFVGEKAADMPVWPIFRQNGQGADLVGYVFESIDLAPIPGFSGTPVNLLIALTPQGQFLDVRVLSQHEPVFVDGLGPEPLFHFVAQYQGLSLTQNIRIGGPRPDPSSSASGTSQRVRIDGVAKATASVRIINQTLLASALKVARAKLGFSGSAASGPQAQIRDDLVESLTWSGLRSSKLAAHLHLEHADVDAAFAGTPAAHAPDANADPGDPAFIDLYATLVDIPSVRSALLTEADARQVAARSQAGDHVLLVMSRGPFPFVSEDYIRGAVPDRISLTQAGLPIELRDMDLDLQPRTDPPFTLVKVFRIIGAAGLDPSQPIDIHLAVTRSVGVIFPERHTHDFIASIRIPERFLTGVEREERGWQGIWQGRWLAIAVTGGAVLLLMLALWRLPAPLRRLASLRRWRMAFALFTLCYLGLLAQGQLSIVNIVALEQASLQGRSWEFFLYDPISTVLWIAVAFSVMIWGRGTFCGWLCPYGAAQELVHGGARALARIKALRRFVPKPIRVRPVWDRRLKKLKYFALALILVSAAVSVRLGDLAVELEPFKTAITLYFVRDWPFVIYAAAMILASIVVYKSYCRYLCPLGAALAILGRLRRWKWIERRSECGTPCQTCRYRCQYQAIDSVGAIDYQECFQCLDCVAIYHDDHACAPRIAQLRHKRPVIPIRPVATGPVTPSPAGSGLFQHKKR